MPGNRVVMRLLVEAAAAVRATATCRLRVRKTLICAQSYFTLIRRLGAVVCIDFRSRIARSCLLPKLIGGMNRWRYAPANFGFTYLCRLEAEPHLVCGKIASKRRPA